MIRRLFPSSLSRRSRLAITAVVMAGVAAALAMTHPAATAATDAAEGGGAEQDARVGNSGLPVPRMVSLGAQEINMRTGPGTRYPIKWVYTRKGLPVRVEAEFDIWRKIRDRDGETGWVHGSMLSGRRTVEIASRDAGGIATLHDKADNRSAAVLRAENGVIAELLGCEADWCRVQIDGKKGWARRDALWGLMPGDGGKS